MKDIHLYLLKACVTLLKYLICYQLTSSSFIFSYKSFSITSLIYNVQSLPDQLMGQIWKMSSKSPISTWAKVHSHSRTPQINPSSLQSLSSPIWFTPVLKNTFGKFFGRSSDSASWDCASKKSLRGAIFHNKAAGSWNSMSVGVLLRGSASARGLKPENISNASKNKLGADLCSSQEALWTNSSHIAPQHKNKKTIIWIWIWMEIRIRIESFWCRFQFHLMILSHHNSFSTNKEAMKGLGQSIL